MKTRHNSMLSRIHLLAIIFCLALQSFFSSGESSVQQPPSWGGGEEKEATPTTGRIEDVDCDLNQLEQVNDAQLFPILNDLRQKTFFRYFAVDLSQKCTFLNNSTSNQNPTSGDAEDETGQCASDGLPGLDRDAPPACSIQSEDNGLFSFQSTNDFFSSSELSSTSPSKENSGNDHSVLVDNVDGQPKFTGLEEFQNLSSALRFSVGSGSQRDKSVSTETTDFVVPSNHTDAVACDDVSLSDEFWMDICSNITFGSGAQIVDLVLNPKRNTGYNGERIWNAIYDENCITIGRDQTEQHSEPMCYEERVLYKLLSGLQSSTSISIAKNYYPPPSSLLKSNWDPNPQYLMKKFERHPERISNLHFSYLVLLRALQKASSFLYYYDFRTGTNEDDEQATALLQRLVDSTILSSCQGVFTAFDESLMFKEASEAEKLFPGTTRDVDTVSLQRNFKGVFQNISSILDCVQCQQCRLHGKMTMLAYGTALKILFTREDLITTSSPPFLERNEIVALINTIAKYSESIRDVRELTRHHGSS